MTDTLPLREQIARIIDGGAWQRHGFTGDPDWHPDDQRLEQRRSLAKADAIMALLNPSLPDGWVAVPLEPTEAMMSAGWCDRSDYRRMLSARPTPPTEPPSEQEDKRPGWQRNLEHSFSPDPPWVAPSNIWGRTYIRYLRKGHDHGSAAFAADEAERRANTPPPQPLETER